jgi:hypothetical protein
MIGLGELGMNPWDFYKYSMSEFEAKLEGHREAKKEQWYHTRAIVHGIAKYAGRMLKNPNISPSQLWPLFDEKPKAASIAQITDPEERKQAVNQLVQRYKDAGWIKDN